MKNESKREKAKLMFGVEDSLYSGLEEETKDLLIKEGLKYIEPETTADWLIFVNKNSENDLSISAVKATISMMEKVENGMSFVEAEKLVYDEEYCMSGYFSAFVASAVSHFAKFKEEYKNYWNSRFGVTDTQEKGIVNPAIITLKHKNE